MRRSSRGSTFASSSASSSSKVAESSQSSIVVETQKSKQSISAASAGLTGRSASQTSVSERVAVGGSIRGGAVIGGQTSQTSVSERVAVGGGFQGGSTAVTTSEQEVLTYDANVAEARLRLRPITTARASIMFGASDSGVVMGNAMVPYTGGRAGGFRGATSAEARQLAMQLDTIIDTRQKDKSELWSLNERLAEYVEKTRFLEAQNKRLVSEADILKTAFSTESVTLKARYQVEIDETARLTELAEIRIAELTSKVAVAEENYGLFEADFVTIETANDTNQSIKSTLITQLGELEAELATLRRRVGDFDIESNRYRGTIQRLRQEESDLRRDLDQERMMSLVSQNTATQLKEEINFMLETQKTKTTEMTGLAYRDTTEENRLLWQSEFSQLFRTMHADYMVRMEEVHSEAAASFQMRLSEQQTTSTKDTVEARQLTVETQRAKQQVDYLTSRSIELTTRIAQYESQMTEMTKDSERFSVEYQERVAFLTSELETYRSELENTRLEVNTILDDKLSLELEITNYAQLLDAEEIRIKDDIQSVIEDQRQVKELMASRGIYDASEMAGFGVGGAGGGISSFQSGSYSASGAGGFGSGFGASSSFGGGFGGGYSGGASSSYYSSSGGYSSGMGASYKF